MPTIERIEELFSERLNTTALVLTDKKKRTYIAFTFTPPEGVEDKWGELISSLSTSKTFVLTVTPRGNDTSYRISSSLPVPSLYDFFERVLPYAISKSTKTGTCWGFVPKNTARTGSDMDGFDTFNVEKKI